MSESNSIGNRYGRLVVLSEERSCGRTYWRCQCDCGSVKAIYGNSVRSGLTRSCGCLRKEIMTDKATSHGHSKSKKSKTSPTYSSWRAMWARCTNGKNIGFANYGGRGIKVCERWQEFANFLADMGEKPPRHSIDRIDSNGHYEPNNCRWATSTDQNRNTRASRMITWDGQTMCLAAWAEKLGVERTTLNDRLFKHGWSVERAMTESVHAHFRRNGATETLARAK